MSVGVVWGMVNFGPVGPNSWKYNANIYGNLQFNILCAVLFIMGLFSVVFMKSTDVYELLNLNNNVTEAREEDIERTEENGGDQKLSKKQKTNKCKVLVKILVTLTFLVLVLG